MAKKAKRFENETVNRKDEDYGLLPGLEHVAYMSQTPYIQKEKFGGDGVYVSPNYEKKLHKLLVK